MPFYARPWLGRATAQTQRPPTRLLIVHKPCGTVPANYDIEGTDERGFTLSRILAPFEGLRDQMVVVEGLDIRKKRNTPGQDHGNGMVTFMTGGVTIEADGYRAVIADRISVDQIIAGDPSFVGEAPIPSLQLAADLRSDRNEVFTRVLSYTGRASPRAPEQRPEAAFARVFAPLTDRGTSMEEQNRLERERARGRSVLDFSRENLARLREGLPSDQRDKLETHLEAIRELERSLDERQHVNPACADFDPLSQTASSVDPDDVNEQHGPIGLAHLDLIRTAFQCDLTRVATFGWAAGNSHVNFSRLLDVQNASHHRITHSGNNRAHDETLIHEWYNQQMAQAFQRFRDTPDVDGTSLLDNTLIVVFSEIRLGRHTFDNVPIQLFGGAGGRLAGGRRVRYDGRSTNDLWLTLSRGLGLEMDCFGDEERCDGPLPNLLS